MLSQACSTTAKSSALQPRLGMPSKSNPDCDLGSHAIREDFTFSWLPSTKTWLPGGNWQGNHKVTRAAPPLMAISPPAGCHHQETWIHRHGPRCLLGQHTDDPGQQAPHDQVRHGHWMLMVRRLLHADPHPCPHHPSGSAAVAGSWRPHDELQMPSIPAIVQVLSASHAQFMRKAKSPNRHRIACKQHMLHDLNRRCGKADCPELQLLSSNTC